MKTKVTYCSFFRSLIATIVAVIGFALVSVGQISLRNGDNPYNNGNPNDPNYFDSNKISEQGPCGSGRYYKLSTEGWASFRVYDGNTELTTYEYEGANTYCNGGLSGYKCQLNGNAASYVYVKIDVDNSKVILTNTPPNCGPTISNITNGTSSLSSVCLNKDTERNSITTPTTVTGATAGAGHQGWTINGSKNTTLTLDYIKNPANMAELNGATLQYWAEDASTNPSTISFSNEVTLSVCLPEVGRIDATGKSGGVTYICLNAKLLEAPPVSGIYTNSGWEVIETGARYKSLIGEKGNQSFVDNDDNEIPLASLYGKQVRFYVSDSYGNTSYSENVVQLLSKPTVTIDLDGYANQSTCTRELYVCDGEQLSEFPSVSYSLNGTRLSKAKWYVFNTEGTGDKWEEYNTQILSADGPYTYIAYLVYPVSKICGEYSSTFDSKTELKFKTTSLEIKFNPELENSYLCTSGATATVTDMSNNIVEGETYWLKNDVYIGKTNVNTYNFTFDCEVESGEITLGAYVKDPVSGCRSSVSRPVTVNSNLTSYLYVGGVGASSTVTNANSWVLLNADGTINESVHPRSDFSADGCRYIINTDGVELLSTDVWNVSGNASKIVIGDGIWNSLAGRPTTGGMNQFDVKPAAECSAVVGGYYENMKACSNTGWIENLSNIAKCDYRANAKVFKISGTLNTNNDVVVDVKSGSSLTIATEKGNFKLGTLAQDKVALSAPILSDGVTNGYSWAAVVPGSSVTYTDNGVLKIREGVYSQLYMEKPDNVDKVIFENGVVVEIKQSLYSNTTTAVSPQNSTVLYSGSVNQDVAAMTYYNLYIANASNKTIGKTFYVNNSLKVEPSSTFEIQGSCIAYIKGSGNNAFINQGNVICGSNTTVAYNASSNTIVAPVYYGKLNLGNGVRTFSTAGVIGISNALNVGSATCTTAGSIIEFDGAGAQSIPSLEYYNLTINNSGLDGSNDYQVSLAGDVIVNNKLSLVEGILNTNGKSLTVTNTSTGAVGQGYRVSADSASYVIGYITRALPSNMPGTGSESYVFPVGTSDRYMPLSMSKIATGTDAFVTVGITPTVSSASVVSPLTSVNTNAYWKIDGTNYTSSSVSVSSSNGLSSCNTLGFEKEGSSSFENIVGCSVSDNSICASSIVEGNGTVALANRNINAKTYYYNCSGNASSNSSWGTNTNGAGTHPSVNFDEDDATYIFNCGATITNDLTISGSNTKVYFNTDYTSKLQIEANVTLPIVEHKRGLVEVAETGELNILNMYIMKDEVSNATDNNYETQQKMRKNRSILRNEGTVNIYNSNLTLTNSFVENSGNLNFYNTDISLSSTMDQGPDYNVINTDIPHTRFVNDGIIRMYNGSLLVERKSVHVRNGDGAVWLIDNTSSPSKTVKFNNVEFIDDGNDVQFVNFECGSSFMVKHSNVDFVYGGQTGKKNGMNGEVVVYDGNLYVKCNNGLGDFTIHECGSVYMIDTDDSGDGVFMVDGGSGWKMTVEGKLYAVGILNKSDGSGNKFNVAYGAQIFVGDIGVTSSSSHSWDFSLDVQNGGTMNYCGNRTSGSDALGKNEGTLNYAGSFYQNSSPATQGDVGGSGTETILYADGTECMADYEETVHGNQGSIILPVELTMLYGICKDNVVELHWQTATESNNELFVVLRSFDGVNFEELGTVLGAGTTTEVQNYAFYDNDEKTGIVYYKLRQIDFDGKTKDSKIVAVQTCGKNAQFSIAEDEIVVTFKNPEEKNYVIVTSLTGKIVFSKSFENVPEARIASPRIKGIYIISVIDKSQITSEKFIR